MLTAVELADWADWRLEDQSRAVSEAVAYADRIERGYLHVPPSELWSDHGLLDVPWTEDIPKIKRNLAPRPPNAPASYAKGWDTRKRGEQLALLGVIYAMPEPTVFSTLPSGPDSYDHRVDISGCSMALYMPPHCQACHQRVGVYQQHLVHLSGISESA